MQKHIMPLAAGLSYYFVMSLFPALILAAAILGYLPIPHLFGTILHGMQRVVPPDSMGLVKSVLRSVVTPHKRSFLTFGILGTIYAASNGFSSLIDALNVCYDVPETRPMWKTRLLAVGLMAVTGMLLFLGAIAMFLGPQFGSWIARHTTLGEAFAELWPALRWTIAIAFTVLAVEIIFYWAPNVKQKFLASLPGAILGVAFWITASSLLGMYFHRFANYNKTYGTLAAGVGLMVWLYWSWFVILIGAELNAELLKAHGDGKLELKQPPPRVIRARPAWEKAA